MTMQTTDHGFMDGHGFMGTNSLWTVVGVLLAVFLVVAILKLVQRK